MERSEGRSQDDDRVVGDGIADAGCRRVYAPRLDRADARDGRRDRRMEGNLWHRTVRGHTAAERTEGDGAVRDENWRAREGRWARRGYHQWRHTSLPRLKGACGRRSTSEWRRDDWKRLGGFLCWGRRSEDHPSSAVVGTANDQTLALHRCDALRLLTGLAHAVDSAFRGFLHRSVAAGASR